MIKVVDNFFTEEIREEIFELMVRPKWSLTGGNQFNSFWHMEELESEDYFSSFLFKKIHEKIGFDCRVGRIYANGQTSCQGGNLHKDGNDVTFLYYPNPQWDIDWRGELIFVDENKSPYKIVEYKPNRAVWFTGDILHYVSAPDRFFNGLRVSLAYKLWT